jgi:opacity protein-like surface antigen
VALLRIFGFVLAAVVCSTAWAENELTLQRNWTAQSYVALAGARDEWLPSLNVGVGYNPLPQLSLNVEVAAYGVFQDGENAGAGEARLMLRHHFFVKERWTAFADVGFGAFEASERVPEGGTRFNFVFRSGLGVSYELRDGMYLMGGARYWHLSNAKMEGDLRNPSINGVEGYVGLMWTWK